MTVRTTPRRVMLSLEVETDAPLNELRSARCYTPARRGEVICNGRLVTVLQAQANVIRGRIRKKARKR